MNQPQTSRRATLPAPCGITGHALVEVRHSEIAGLRDRPAADGAPALPARFLRHCDEHTVVGMHAVLGALAARGDAGGDVSRHAVVSASCQIGRLTAAKTLAGLATGGAVSVSTHIVPQCSLHSVAGAVSVALGMHGPHLGVGGGVDAFAEGLFAAATLLQAAAAGEPPCVWLVATEWVDEPAIDHAGTVVGDPVCRGLALAIEPDPPDAAADCGRTRAAAARSLAAVARRSPAPTISSLSLTLHVPDGPRVRPAAPAAGRLAEFARALEMCRTGTALVSWVVECPWGAEIRVGVRRRHEVRDLSSARLREAA